MQGPWKQQQAPQYCNRQCQCDAKEKGFKRPPQKIPEGPDLHGIKYQSFNGISPLSGLRLPTIMLSREKSINGKYGL